MHIFRDTKSLLEYTSNINKTIGFVPTMGALHEGHVSLMRKAKEQNEIVVVSIFVNPTQFLPNEDLDKYPRKIEADIKICELAGVNALFLPAPEEMYQKDEPKILAPDHRAYILEGFFRPKHFDGVLTVVMKLLNLTCATNAYFGQKDAQQLVLIQDMVKKFYMSVNIVPCQTQREDDGLALSSRNVYLDKEQRKEALKISKSLFRAAAQIADGEQDAIIIKEGIKKELDCFIVDYVEITDRALIKIDKIELGNSIILVAIRTGSVRLIDNLWI